MQKFIVFFLVAVLLLPLIVFARAGVGIGVGKIRVEESMKAGAMYRLPSLPVLNTGDEAGEYTVGIEYHEGVPQFRPAREWFNFNPSSFHLGPGKRQDVAIRLTLPLKTRPGDYFAYLEARPVIKSEAGKATIGIAAAAKLYFTVTPANIWQGIYYRVISFWTMYSPWTWIVSALIIGAVFITLFRKFFKFHLGIKISKK